MSVAQQLFCHNTVLLHRDSQRTKGEIHGGRSLIESIAHRQILPLGNSKDHSQQIKLRFEKKPVQTCIK